MTSRFASLKVLAVFAHPDDEGFGSGGTLAMLSARGTRITLVCATNGDVGEISDPSLATPDTLAQVRQEELRQAMTITGVDDVRFLNYRDSGMAGTPENQHPASLHQAPDERVAGQLSEIIGEVAPDLMMTHDPTGGYGHPDHKAVCRHTTTAWESSDAHGRPASGRAALYYACYPRSAFRRMWREMLDLGISPPFASLDIDSLGTPDEEVTTVVDVTACVDTKIASLNCHRTQLDPNGPFAQLPEEKNREYMSVEYFTLVPPSSGETPGAAPGATHGEPPPHDILKALAGEFGESNAG